jgi:hypothetical protein
VSTVDEHEEYPSLELIAELALDQSQRQLDRIDALDAKLATLVAFSGLLVGLLFNARFLTDDWNIILSLGTVLLLLAIVVLLMALRVRGYRLDPNVRTLREQYPNRSLDETRFSIIDNVVDAMEGNEGKLLWKGRFLNAGAALVFVALALVAGRSLYLLQW